LRNEFAAKRFGENRALKGTIAVSKEPLLLDERAPYPTEIVSGWPSYLSKIYQEKLALDVAATLGLELMVVNPSLLLGPRDERNSSTGDVRRFLRREIPVVPEGGISFVDARDAATATVAALTRGRAGERYLLSGPNWTCADYFGRLERASKVRAPSPSRWSRSTGGATCKRPSTSWASWRAIRARPSTKRSAICARE
jgi:dihydroflavonol-4-reductase